MKKNKFYIYSFLLFAIFIIAVSSLGIFKTGILSDTFGDAYTAVNSTFSDKLTNNLQYIDRYRYRPVLFLTLKGIVNIQKSLGISYDNFVFYKLINLFLYILFAFIAGIIIFRISKDIILSVFSEAVILFYPNNLHNLCWSAAYFEILCGIFFLFSFLYTLKYIADKKTILLIISLVSFAFALLTKEMAVSFPFICILLVYIIYGKETVVKNKNVFILQFAVLLIYFVSKMFLIRSIPVFLGKFFQGEFWANSAQIIFKGIIASLIPYDFSVLRNELKEYNILVLIYLIFTAVFVVFSVIEFVKQKQVKNILFLILVFLFSLSPLIYAGYLRPQLILLTFTVMIVGTICTVKLNSKMILYSLMFIFEIWLFLDYGVIDGWKTAYAEGNARMGNVIKTDFNSSKKNIIIGNPARMQQYFMYDNIMFPYNYFKYHSFVIKDTILDLVRTVSLDKNSLISDIIVNKTGEKEYELICTGKTQFFYLDGDEKEIKNNNGIKNDFMSVQYLEFNNLGKPVMVLLKILSDNCDFYIFRGNNLVKLD